MDIVPIGEMAMAVTANVAAGRSVQNREAAQLCNRARCAPQQFGSPVASFGSGTTFSPIPAISLVSPTAAMKADKPDFALSQFRRNGYRKNHCELRFLPTSRLKFSSDALDENKCSRFWEMGVFK